MFFQVSLRISSLCKGLTTNIHLQHIQKKLFSTGLAAGAVPQRLARPTNVLHPLHPSRRLGALPTPAPLALTHFEKQQRYSDPHALLALVPLFLFAQCESNVDDEKQLCILAKGRQPALLQRFKQLLEKGVHVNSKHPGGWTALHAAVVSNNVPACELLLQHGARVNEVDTYDAASMEKRYARRMDFSPALQPHAPSEGMTALHYAALFGSHEMVALLLEHGADPTIKTKSGHTAVDCTVDKKLQETLTRAQDTWASEQVEKARQVRAANPLHLQLKKHIVGQDAPIDAVCAAICRRQNGWHDDAHPMVFLFLGSSGIGKTELAKRLAEFLHEGNPKAFVRFDMSEYQEKHEVAKFIGSPPGYIGHDEGGQLVNQLRACSNAVVLLDEVEKAHPDVLTVLLQLFDEGRLTDGKGATVDCTGAIFVMTSNLAQDHIAEFATDFRLTNGPDATVQASKAFKEKIIRPILKSHFQRDEFLGRIHEVLFFWPFSAAQLRMLVVKELDKWATRAKERHDIDLVWDEGVVSVLASHYNIHYGARSLQHAVNRLVINKLASAHEENRIKRSDRVRLVPSADPDDVALEISSPAGPASSSAGSWLPWRRG